MRSNVIFRVQNITGNKFELCQAFSKMTRVFQGLATDTQKVIALAFDKAAVSSVIKRLAAPSPVLVQALQLCL